MKSMKVSGVLTTLVTPFRNNALDPEALVRLVERQIAAGVDGLIVTSGCVGEAPTLAKDEARRAIELCVATARGRLPVIAGAASNATSAAIALVRQAAEAGADAVLVTAPWYNRPSQEGLRQHFQTVAEAIPLPVIVGHNPSRCRVDLTEATLARLRDLPNLIGLEDGSGDVARLGAIRRMVGADFMLLSSHDATGLGAAAFGADGWSSVTANVAPAAVLAMFAACSAGDWPGARAWQDRLVDLQTLFWMDPVPSAVKFALSSLGLCLADVRLPVTSCPTSVEAAVRDAVQASGLR